VRGEAPRPVTATTEKKRFAKDRKRKKKGVTDTPLEDSMASRSVVLKLNHRQRVMLKELASAYNYVWNRAVRYIHQVANNDLEGRALFEQKKRVDAQHLLDQYKKDRCKLKESHHKTLEQANQRVAKAETKCKDKPTATNKKAVAAAKKKVARLKLSYQKRVIKAVKKHERDRRKVFAQVYVPPVGGKEVRENACRYSHGEWNPDHLRWFKEFLQKHWGYQSTDRTRDCAALGVVDVLKACRTKNITSFDIKFRSRKDNFVTVFNQRDFAEITKPRRLGPLLDRNNRPVRTPSSEFKIIFNRSTRQWRLFHTIPLSRAEVDEEERREVLTLDPGVITTYTGVCLETYKVYEYDGIEHVKKYIVRLKNKADKLRRIIAKEKKQGGDKSTLRRLRKNMCAANDKVSRRIKDAHCCIAKDMCKRFRNIILPEFRVKGMTGKGRLGKGTKKVMLAWSHYRFKGVLAQAARRHDTTVIESWEPYTSQTCSQCYRLTRCTGREFKCRFDDCRFKCSRDWNGAINNALVCLVNPP
jgi:transposase